LNPNCNGNRRDKVALRTTCIKNVNFKIIKTRTGCQCVGYFYYSENLNWAAQNSRLGHGLDIAGPEEPCIARTIFVKKICLHLKKNTFRNTRNWLYNWWVIEKWACAPETYGVIL